MPTELRRGTFRLVANYMRLGAFVVFGILFVPIFISGVGIDAFGILGLLGGSIGIAEMCQAIVNRSMNRELTAAYHSEDPREFTTTYNSAILLAAGMALITAVLFAVLYLLLPFFRIPDHLMEATAWLLFAKASLSMFTALLGPQFNMFLVTERMAWFNFWRTLRRGSDLFAAVVLFLLPGWIGWLIGLSDPRAGELVASLFRPADSAAGLKTFGFLSVGVNVAVLIISVILIMRTDRRLLPNLRMVRRDSIRQLFGTAGWNTVVVTAMNLHIRVDMIIMNLFFGTVGNAVFSLAVRLTSYVWQIAGVTADGLDVVSARMSTTKRTTVTDLMRHSTRLQAAAVVPAGLLVLFLATPAMTLWVGQQVEDVAQLERAIILSKILVIGMVGRSMTESWQRVLYGAGHIREYAPLVLMAGLLNPVLAIALIWLLPEEVGYVGPAIAYSAAFVILHFFWLPRIAARCLQVSYAEIVSPVLRPTVSAGIASTLLFVPPLLGTPTSLWLIVPAVVLFGLTHAAMCWILVLSREERERIRNAARRQSKRLPGRSRHSV